MKSTITVAKKTAPKRATLKWSEGSSEDVKPITISRGVNTTPDLYEQLMLDYKNSYNELLVVHRELMDKYEQTNTRLGEAELIIAEQKHRSTTLPTLYRDQFHGLLLEHRDLTKKYNALKDGMRDLLD